MYKVQADIVNHNCGHRDDYGCTLYDIQLIVNNLHACVHNNRSQRNAVT